MSIPCCRSGVTYLMLRKRSIFRVSLFIMEDKSSKKLWSPISYSYIYKNPTWLILTTRRCESTTDEISDILVFGLQFFYQHFLFSLLLFLLHVCVFVFVFVLIFVFFVSFSQLSASIPPTLLYILRRNLVFAIEHFL